jgi:hypothetical protein
MRSKSVTDLVERAVDEFLSEFPEDEECVDCEQEEVKETKSYVDSTIAGNYGATSYAELEMIEEEREKVMEFEECLMQFPTLASNIMQSPAIDDKVSALKTLSEELARKLSEISRNYPSDGEYKEQEITESQEEKKEMSFIEKVKEAVHSLFPSLFKEQPKEHSEPFMIWKGNDGVYRWVARYSNNIRDRDNPPEIISSTSHRRFVELVDKGLAPYPELWLWHVKEWKIGQATWVSYDDAGFALAAGLIDKGKEQVAEWLSKNADKLGVSHGMPPTTIKRDEEDQTIIVEHETREISPLPAWAAANEITNFFIAKEDSNMAIPQEKRKTLLEWGIGENLLSAIETMNAEDANKASEAGIETKENSENIPAVPEPIVDAPQDTKEETTEEVVPTPPEKQQEITREEIAEAVSAVLLPVINQISELKAEVDGLRKELAREKASDEERIKQLIVDTPTASLGAMLSSRVLGNANAKVKEDNPLFEAKPKETPLSEKRTGIQFIDKMLSGS